MLLTVICHFSADFYKVSQESRKGKGVFVGIQKFYKEDESQAETIACRRCFKQEKKGLGL